MVLLHQLTAGGDHHSVPDPLPARQAANKAQLILERTDQAIRSPRHILPHPLRHLPPPRSTMGRRPVPLARRPRHHPIHRVRRTGHHLLVRRAVAARPRHRPPAHPKEQEHCRRRLVRRVRRRRPLHLHVLPADLVPGRQGRVRHHLRADEPAQHFGTGRLLHDRRRPRLGAGHVHPAAPRVLRPHCRGRGPPQHAAGRLGDGLLVRVPGPARSGRGPRRAERDARRAGRGAGRRHGDGDVHPVVHADARVVRLPRRRPDRLPEPARREPRCERP